MTFLTSRVPGRDCVDSADADAFFPDFYGFHRGFNLNYDPVASQGFPTWLTKDGQQQENNRVIWLEVCSDIAASVDS